MEAQTVAGTGEDEQQEVIYLVVDENQQGQQVTQIVSDGQLMGQQAQIIMQDGKQAVLITESSEQQVVLLDDEVSPEAVQTALQQGAVQQEVVTQQPAPAQPQEVVVQSSVPSTSMNGSQMQYVINDKGQIIVQASPKPVPVQPSSTAQHQLIVTSAGLVRADGIKSKTEAPAVPQTKSVSLVNTAIAQAVQAKSPRQPDVVMVHPGDSPPTFSTKPTLRELIHHTVDTQLAEMNPETSSGVTIVRATQQTSTPGAVLVKPPTTVVQDPPKTITVNQQLAPAPVPVMVEEQSEVLTDSKGDDTDTVPFTEDPLQTVVVSDELITTSLPATDVTPVTSSLPADIMAGGDGPVTMVTTTASLQETSAPITTKITVTNAKPMSPISVHLPSAAKGIRSPPVQKTSPAATTVITVISPAEKQKKKLTEAVKSPAKSPQITNIQVSPQKPVSIAAGRERRTSKPTRYYGLDSDYEMDQPDIYRSYRKDSESGEDKTLQKKTESHDGSQSSDFQSGDDEPQQKKGRGRPKKSEPMTFVRMIPKPTSEVSSEQFKALPVIQVSGPGKTVTDSSEEKSGAEDRANTSPAKRGRGRPKRTVDLTTSADDTIDTDSDSKATSQSDVVQVIVGEEAVKRGRGRPPKTAMSPIKSPDSESSDHTQPQVSAGSPKIPTVVELEAKKSAETSAIGAADSSKTEEATQEQTTISTEIKEAEMSELVIEEQNNQDILNDAEICSPDAQRNEVMEEMMQIDDALELNAITGEMVQKPTTPSDDLAKDPIEDLLSTTGEQNELDDSFHSSTGSGGIIVSKFNDDDENEGFHGTEVIVKQSPFKDKTKKSRKSDESYTKRRSGRARGPVSYLEQGSDEDKPVAKRKEEKKEEPTEEKHEWLTSEVEALQQEISDLKFLNESLQNRLGQESGSPEEVRALQGRIDKLQTTNNELRSKLKDSEAADKKIGINLKQGMKFSFHKGSSVTNTAPSQPTTTKFGVDKNIVKQREIDLAEQELRARESGLDRREMKLKALDRELDDRSSQLTTRESRLERWERKLKSQEKEIEYKEKQLKRFENDFRELGGSGSSKRQKTTDTDGDIDGKLRILQETREDLDKREADITAREKFIQATQAELDKLNADLSKKAEYLESVKQSHSEEDDTSDEKASNTETSSRRKSVSRQSSSTPTRASKLRSSQPSSDEAQTSSPSGAPKSPRTRTPSRKVLEQVQASTPSAQKRKRPQEDAASPVPAKKPNDNSAASEDKGSETPEPSAKEAKPTAKSEETKPKTPRASALKDKTPAKVTPKVSKASAKTPTAKTPASTKKTVKTPASTKTAKTPTSTKTAKTPTSTKTAKTPTSAKTAKTPASTKTAKKPASAKATPKPQPNKVSAPKSTSKSTPKAATAGSTQKTPKSVSPTKTPKSAASQKSTPSLKSPVAKAKAATPAAKKSPASSNLKRKRTSDAPTPSKARRK